MRQEDIEFSILMSRKMDELLAELMSREIDTDIFMRYPAEL